MDLVSLWLKISASVLETSVVSMVSWLLGNLRGPGFALRESASVLEPENDASSSSPSNFVARLEERRCSILPSNDFQDKIDCTAGMLLGGRWEAEGFLF